MSVAVAHDVCDRLERAIKAEFSDAIISIHVEPDNQAKQSGIIVL
jgi:divalent metal cation (Fe/Co/Zn/Cd) transporter